MKVIKWLTMVAGLALLLNSCSTKDEPVVESNLYGYWYNASSNEYMRIMHDENEMKDGLYLGYEWKIGDKPESDLWDPKIDYHGNGWFEWQLNENKLTLIDLMNIGSGKGVQEYKITLTSTNLEMTDTEKRTSNWVKSEQPK